MVTRGEGCSRAGGRSNRPRRRASVPRLGMGASESLGGRSGRGRSLPRCGRCPPRRADPTPPGWRRESGAGSCWMRRSRSSSATGTRPSRSRRSPARPNVSRPVIYSVFDGLGDLLGALLDRQERRALAQLGAAFRDSRRPGSRPSSSSASFARWSTRSPPTRTPGARSCCRQTEPRDVVRGRIDRDRERVRRQFEALLAWVLGRRGETTGVDLELASHSVLVVVEQWGRLVLSDPGRFSGERLAGYRRTAPRRPRARSLTSKATHM